jgi:hypothetical protein
MDDRNNDRPAYLIPVLLSGGASDAVGSEINEAAVAALPDTVIQAGVDCLSTLDLDQLLFRPSPELEREVVSAIYLSMAKQMRLSHDKEHLP